MKKSVYFSLSEAKTALAELQTLRGQGVLATVTFNLQRRECKLECWDNKVA